jgi:hypothetical protein
MYLTGKLKEEQEFAKTRTEEIDIEQSKEAIASLENTIADTETQDIIKRWNMLVDELEALKSQAIRKDYYLGKYFEHKLQ